MTQAHLEEEFGQTDPNCPHCKGTGFVDRDHGYSVNLDLAYANGAFVDAVECGCSLEEDRQMRINRFDLIARIEQDMNRSQTTGLACLIILAVREKTTVAHQCGEWGLTQIDELTVEECDALPQDDLLSLLADIAAGLLEEILAQSDECPMLASIPSEPG